MKKQDRPYSKHIPEGPFDYIVIGSGMGGMTAAAFLAKVGKRVLVLEQHYVPGGFTHVFRRPGFEWDVGVHAVGEVTDHSLTGRLLKKLTDGRLEWAPLGPVYDELHYPDGVRVDLPDSPAQLRENLLDAFPDERDAIDGYIHEVRAVSKAMKGYYLSRTLPKALAPLLRRSVAKDAHAQLARRTKDVLDELTDNEQLKAVFAAQWGYYGSVPSRSSFAIQALTVKHFMHGAYYPVGGSSEIATQLLQTVKDAGGWTTIRADVDEILIENKRAVGVRLSDGRVARATNIVSAAGVSATVRRLLPSDVRAADWIDAIEDLPPAPAHVCLYLGFEGDIREDGATAANKWFYESFNTEHKEWDVRDQDDLPEAPVLYVSFPSLKDPLHEPGPSTRHTGEVVTFVPWAPFEKYLGTRWHKRGEEYEEFKRALTARMLKQLKKHMPTLEDKVVHAELSTPVTTDHFTRPLMGSIYGLEPTVERFENPWLRPRSPIPGLYFAGSEVGTVGVIGAMLGGVLAAAAAEPVRTMPILKAAIAPRGPGG